MSRSPAQMLLSVSKWLFLGVVFLVPITALPWTTDAFETNKQAVLVIGIALACAAYMGALVFGRRSLARPGVVTVVAGALLLMTCLSAAVSLAPMTSWIGQGAQEYGSVLSLISFLGLFFLAKQLVYDQETSQTLLVTLFTSSAVVSLALIPVFFGVHLGTFTNLVGTPHACAIYLLVMSALASGLWLTGVKMTGRWQAKVLLISASLTWLASVVVLIALDSPVLWGLTIVASATLFLVALRYADELQEPLRFVPAMVPFVLALIFLVLPTHVRSPFLQEVSPNLATTWGVVTGAWNDGSVWLGTGPGTFSLMYSKYTNLAVNQTDFWQLIFDRGNAAVTTELATNGVLGVLAWVFFEILLLALALKKIVSGGAGWRQLTPVFTAWFVLVVAAFVYAGDLTLSTLAWVLTALLAAQLLPEKSSSEQPHARARLATILTTIIVLAGAVSTLFVVLPQYAAEVVFAKALQRNGSADTGAKEDEVIRLIDKAAATNPWNDVYARNLAGALLRRLSLLSSDEAADDAYVQSLISSAIAAAMKATDISPNNPLNWEVRGMVYRELMAVVPDAVTPAADAYERAIALAPVNPQYRVDVARVYLALADAQTPYLTSNDAGVAHDAAATQQGAWGHAEDNLLTATALKSDYAPAIYYLALLRQRQGNLAEAVSGLEQVRAQSPTDVGVGLQLGLLYLRQGKNELAKAELERVLTLDPTYANAHWYLSVVYEQTHDLPNAIEEVQKVLETNPNNVTVQTRLDRLQAGQTSDAIPDPIGLTTP